MIRGKGADAKGIWRKWQSGKFRWISSGNPCVGELDHAFAMRHEDAVRGLTGDEGAAGKAPE